MRPFAPKVQEAVSQTNVLGIFLIAEHRQGQFGGFGENLDRGSKNLDPACRELGILGSRRAGADRSIHADDPFGPQAFGELEGRGVRIDDDLGEAIMVAQVDEQKPAVIADAMNPTREANNGADMRLAQLAAGMCPINMHEEVSP
jgi:hypothetical protein